MGTQHGGHLCQLVVDAEFNRLRLQPPGLDLRQVQDVIDELKQCPARGLHRRGHFLLFIVEARLGQQIPHADDGVQRRSKLVAHVSQETTLGLVGCLGFRLGMRQRPNQTGGIGGHNNQADQQPVLLDPPTGTGPLHGDHDRPESHHAH